MYMYIYTHIYSLGHHRSNETQPRRREWLSERVHLNQRRVDLLIDPLGARVQLPSQHPAVLRALRTVRCRLGALLCRTSFSGRHQTHFRVKVNPTDVGPA